MPSFTIKRRRPSSPFRQAPITLFKGIRRDLNFLIPGEGVWTCDGFHTNDLGALTKWPGFVKDSETGLGARVDGLYQVKLGGTTYKIGMAGGIIKRIDVEPPTTIASGLTAGPTDAKVLGSFLYVVNGIEENKKIDSALSLSKMGIAAPTFTPTSIEGAAGTPNGTYSYKCTYANSTTGQESDPSPVSADITVTSKKIAVGGFAASADPQVDRIHIYRTTAGGARWLFLAEINDTDTTYTDDSADSALAEEIAETNGVPPVAKYLEVYNGMMVMAGLASPNQNRVAFSGVLLPEAHDVEDVYDLDPEEEDVISGVKKFGRGLAIFKRNAIYFGTGNDPAFMSIDRTRATEGSLSHWAIVEYKGNLFYPSAHGFYMFDGIQEHYIGEAIEPIYQGLEKAPTVPMSGIFYPGLNAIMWSATTAGQAGTPDTLIMYDVISNEWTTRPLQAARMATFQNSVGQDRMWVGHQDGRVWEGDVGNNDDGASFAATFVSRAGDLDQQNTPELNNFRRINILYDAILGATATVTVSYAIDDPEGTFTTAGTFIPSSGTHRVLKINGRGRRIFVKIATTSTEPLVIRAVQVSGLKLGRYQ